MVGICPHCQNEIDLLEPADLDEQGLTPNVRGPAAKTGDLQPWLRLRSGKFFLYLQSDVDDFLKKRRLASAEKALVKAGFGGLSRDEQIRELQELEKQLREAEE